MRGVVRPLLFVVAVAALAAAPILMRPQGQDAHSGAPELIIITPHNEQIRSEFAQAFEAWHRARYGEPVEVVYSVPGGTSEIRKMLVAQTEAALRAGKEVGGNADLVFGGGTYEHQVLKREVTVSVGGQERSRSISVPVDFPAPWLESVYGENRIGDLNLYDPQRHWFGLALSGFGIVYNRDVLARLGLREPTTWQDLCDPALRRWVALVNPGQSGSVTTAFDAILQRAGWLEGWRILRRMAANARSFSGSSLKPPHDAGRGDAAAGVCIDFFGRYQSQALSAGESGRLGYIDPPGQTVIDPDPISMLRGAPHPELARRFIEFCLSEEGQSLWGFHRGGPGGLGPRQFELRRMAIRRVMYETHLERLVDRVNPYESAGPASPPDRNYRPFIAPLFAAMAMDTHNELAAAWEAIVTHPAFPRDNALVSAWSIDEPELRRMLLLFDAMPVMSGPDGGSWSLADPAHLATIRAGWLDGGWADAGMWSRHDRPHEALRRRCVDFFRDHYERVRRSPWP